MGFLNSAHQPKLSHVTNCGQKMAAVEQYQEEVEEEAAEEEEEEAVDYQEVLREKCGELAKCSSLREKLDTCNERVSGKSDTTETCTEELFDFVHCIDHCVAKNLFKKLK